VLQFYKPWKLRAQEKTRIETQIEEAQTKVDRELTDLSGHQIQQEGNGGGRESSLEASQLDGCANVLETERAILQVSEGVGADGTEKVVSTSTVLDDANATNVAPVEAIDALPVGENGESEKEKKNEQEQDNNSEHAALNVEDAGKENVEDMEEVMVEAGEDPVIY